MKESNLCPTCGSVMKERVLFTSTYFECEPCPGPNGDWAPSPATFEDSGEQLEFDFTNWITYGAPNCHGCQNMGCDKCQPWRLEG